MRAGATRLQNALMTACWGLAMGACQRDPAPVAATPPAEPVVSAADAAPPQAAVAPPVAATPAAESESFSAYYDRWEGAIRSEEDWPAGAIDGLCIVRGPGLDVAGLDDRLRDLSTALLRKPTVDQVLTRALDSEGRLLVRFKPEVTAAVAHKELDKEALLAAPLGTPVLAAATECTLIPRGHRARAIWQVVAPGGVQEATDLARSLQRMLLQVPCVTHVELVGGVQQATILEVQTKTLADNGVGLDQVLDSLTRLSRWPAKEWPQVREQQTIERRLKASDGSPPEVPLSRLVARSSGLVATPRTARNGQVAVTSVVAYGGHACKPQELGKRLPELLGQALATTKARIQPVMTEGIVRLRLSLPRGTAYEGEPSLAKKFHEIRMQPTVIGLYAQSGMDGVPVTFDLDAAGGRTWTMWLTDGEGEGMTVATNAAQLLSASGWQVQVEPVGADTAVTWLLGQTAPAGVILAASEADKVRTALGQATDLLSKIGGRVSLQNGPTRLPGDPKAAAWKAQAASGSVPTPLLLAVDTLHRGPLTLTTELPPDSAELRVMGQAAHVLATLRVVLPGGERAAAAAGMPLTWVQPRDTAAKPTPVLLGTLREEVLPSPVVERLRWNGRPTVWVSSLAFDRAPSAPEMELHQALVTLRIAAPDVQTWPWCEPPVVANNPAPEPPSPGGRLPPPPPAGSPAAPAGQPDRGPVP